MRPCFEVELDGFAEVDTSALDVFALRRDIQFRAAGDVPTVFFGDERREAVGHKQMLAEVR